MQDCFPSQMFLIIFSDSFALQSTTLLLPHLKMTFIYIVVYVEKVRYSHLFIIFIVVCRRAFHTKDNVKQWFDVDSLAVRCVGMTKYTWTTINSFDTYWVGDWRPKNPLSILITSPTEHCSVLGPPFWQAMKFWPVIKYKWYLFENVWNIKIN